MFTKGTDIVALHFSDSSLLALRLDSRDQKYSIAAVSSLALKQGVIEDGRILSLSDLTTAVAQLFSEAKPQALKPKEVVICLPESKVFSVALQLPSGISSNEITDSLRRKVAEVIPVEDQLLVGDYQKHLVGEQMEYFYAATYLTVLEEFTKLFDGLNIKIRMATLESLALATVLGPKEPNQTALILDIGARTTTASIVTNQYVRESVTIAKAGDAWTKAIMEAQGITWEESEQKKRTLGIVTSPDNAVAPIVLPWLQRWSAEIKLFTTYWQQNHSDKILTIMLAGGGAQLPGLVDYIQTALGLPVVVAQAPVGLSLERVDVVKYLTVLGLAMMAVDEKLDDINFMVPKLKNVKRPMVRATILKQKSTSEQPTKTAVVVKPKSSKRRTMILLAILLIVIIGFGLVWWRSLSPTTNISVPASTTASDNQNAEINFVVAVNNAKAESTPGQPVLAGTLETRSVVGTAIQLNTDYWQTIKDRAVKEGGATTDKQLIYKELISDQAQIIWDKEVVGLAETVAGSQRTLIENYISYTVATSTLSSANITPESDQLLSLTINYQVVTVDQSRVRSVIQDIWQAKFQQDLPADYHQTNVTVLPLTKDLYQVYLIATSPIR